MTISRSTRRTAEYVTACVAVVMAVVAVNGSAPSWMWIGLAVFGCGLVALAVDDKRQVRRRLNRR